MILTGVFLLPTMERMNYFLSLRIPLETGISIENLILLGYFENHDTPNDHRNCKEIMNV